MVFSRIQGGKRCSFLGHRRGGLALSTIGGCGFFGAVCGSSPATAATFGRVALPEMLRRNYTPSFATGTIAAGGTLGSLVPPSVIMIIYAIMAEEFILTLFLAAVIPAAMEIIFYLITVVIWMNVFVLSGVTGFPINVIYKGTLPFVLADIVRLMLLVLFPAFVLWLPGIVQ